MANELVFDVGEGIGALAAQLVDRIEKTRLDREAGLRACGLQGFQGGVGRIEDDAA